jgi:hypothetical protein
MVKISASQRVVVKFHAGYKGEEEPRRVIVAENEWAVEHILERKRVSDHKTGKSHEEFTCLVNKKPAKLFICSNGQHYLTFINT